jgi:hypothetical protein
VHEIVHYARHGVRTVLMLARRSVHAIAPRCTASTLKATKLAEKFAIIREFDRPGRSAGSISGG